jgi:hypothetical protein
MTRIPKTKEWPTRYMTPFVTIMEPRETFIGRAMRRSNVRARLLIKAKHRKSNQRDGETMNLKLPL